MLDYADDVQETFMQTFGISYTDVFGSTISHNLKPDGDKIPVTNANRQVCLIQNGHQQPF